MSRVYVDAATAVIEAGGERGIDPAAARALRFLIEAGHEVLLVSPDGEEPSGELRAVATAEVPEAPMVPDAPAWYLTTNVEACRGKSARLRTVLVGAAPPSTSIRRCDAVARDLQAAVLEILAAEAMPSA